MRDLPWTVLFCLAAFRTQTGSAQVEPLDLWPRFPLPSEVIVQRSDRNLPDAVILETAAGLAARHARVTASAQPYVWIVGDHGRDAEIFFPNWKERTRVPSRDFKGGVWDLVAELKGRGVVKGYVLYHADASGEKAYDEKPPTDLSLNTATSLCGRLQAIAVEESLEPQAKKLGLPLLADCRGKDLAWVLKTFGKGYNDGLLALLDPRAAVARDMAVASDALVVINTPGGGLAEALRLMRPDGTVFGWGISPEDQFVQAISKAGLKMLPSNWTNNLPLLASAPGPLAPAGTTSAAGQIPPVEAGVHYVAFVMSDGDNLSWFTGDYFGKLFYGNPARGSLPFGWTVPFSTLAETAPDAWRGVAAKATPNDDYVQFGIRGYTFVDEMPPAVLAADATRLARDLAGPRVTAVGAFTWDAWNGPAARAASGVIARNIPGLRGILSVQYTPYAAGRGASYTVQRDNEKIPVLSPLYAIWKMDRPNDCSGPPADTADAVNAWSRRPVGKPEDQFAWIVVHAWSDFGNNVEGVSAAAECAKRLGPGIKVVKPSELMGMLYHQLNPDIPTTTRRN